jgi:hypothetical protein
MSGAELGGAGICLLRLISYILKVEGNIVIVINSEDGPLNDRIRELNVKLYILPSIYVKKIYRLSQITQLIRNIFSFRNIISKEKPSIIHAFTLPSARRVWLLKKLV